MLAIIHYGGLNATSVDIFKAKQYCLRSVALCPSAADKAHGLYLHIIGMEQMMTKRSADDNCDPYYSILKKHPHLAHHPYVISDTLLRENTKRNGKSAVTPSLEMSEMNILVMYH
jgi:hypothetical protein